MKSLLKKLLHNPKKIFLIDAAGALLTCVLLILILTKLNSLFGMPAFEMKILAAIAFLFFCYSTFCFFLFSRINWKVCLIIIACANLIYCGLTFVLLIYNYKIITPFDWIYFLGEIAIIIYLVSIEMKMVKG